MEEKFQLGLAVVELWALVVHLLHYHLVILWLIHYLQVVVQLYQLLILEQV